MTQGVALGWYEATRRVNTPCTAIGNPFFIRVIREIRGSNCCF